MEIDRKTPASFPLASSETDVNGEVECCIEKAVMDLLSQCVFSGIMITYDVPGFPLYYIDERMLSLLNYSNQADLIAIVFGQRTGWAGRPRLHRPFSMGPAIQRLIE